MASYTQLTIKDACEILGLYDERDPTSLKALSPGISNSNYLVEFANDPWLLLKVSNDKNFSELQEEQKILSALHKIDLSFCLPALKTHNDHLVYQWRGLSGVVYPFLRGHLRVDKDSSFCYDIGKKLAELHLKTQNLTGLRDYRSVSVSPEEILETVQDPAQNSAIERECLDFKTHWNELKQTLDLDSALSHIPELKQAIIHGDLYHDNVMWGEDGEMLAFLDFEQSGWGPCLFDLAVSISDCCWDPKLNKYSKELFQAYLSGYEEIRKLPQPERTFLPHFVHFGLMSIALWRVKRFNLKKIVPGKTSLYKELLERSKILFHDDTKPI